MHRHILRLLWLLEYIHTHAHTHTHARIHTHISLCLDCGWLPTLVGIVIHLQLLPNAWHDCNCASLLFFFSLLALFLSSEEEPDTYLNRQRKETIKDKLEDAEEMKVCK